MSVERRMILVFGFLMIMAGCSSGEAQKSGKEEQPRAAASSQAGAAASQTPASQSPAPVSQVRVPAGTFIFGPSEKEFEAFLASSLINFPGMKEKFRRAFVMPARKLELPEFAIDQFEVTNEQYRQFVQATGYRPPDLKNYLVHWTGTTNYPTWAETFPVVWISQEDAEAYCRWRGGRLPTEEEWEKAARGTDGGFFPWGNDYSSTDTANIGGREPKAEPAGNRPGDKSPYEVYDMGGNVAEITSSLIAEGNQARVVLRGGTYRGSGREAATFNRMLVSSSAVRSETVGCRCVKGQ